MSGEMIEEAHVMWSAKEVYEASFRAVLNEGDMKQIMAWINMIKVDIDEVKRKIKDVEKSEEDRFRYGYLIPEWRNELIKLTEQLRQLERRRDELRRRRRELGNVDAKVSELRAWGREIWNTIEKDLSVLEGHIKAYLSLQSEYNKLKNAYEFLSEDDEPFPPALELGRDVKSYVRERIN